MPSKRILEFLVDGWSQPTLSELFQHWWYLILLSLLVASALVWLMIQLVKTDLEMRRAGPAATDAVHYRGRRRFLIGLILLVMMALFLSVYPILKTWYGLE